MIWKGVYGRMRVKPEEGLDVIVSGKLTTFAGSSKYQIVIDTLEPAGVGALMKLLEERKKKLAAEGLFDEARKQLLPFLPRSDRRRHLADRRRHPRHSASPGRPLSAPRAGVAGARAGRAVGRRSRGRHRGFNALPERGPLPRPDLIIVARGGGSLEDLWSFNEEIVVRAAAESMIPLISAVGHETDITLIDFAADRRAPTPTAAAEMAVPVRAELAGEIAALAARQLRAGSAAWTCAAPNCCPPRARCRRSTTCWPVRASGSMPAPSRLPRALRANAQTPPHPTDPRRRAAVAAAAACAPVARLSEIVARLEQRRLRAGRVYLDRRSQRLRSAGQLLAAFSYRGVLARGFALVRDGEGHPLRAAAAVSGGMRLDIEFADGRVGAVADGEATAAPAPRAKPRPRGGGPAGRAACSALDVVRNFDCARSALMVVC